MSFTFKSFPIILEDLVAYVVANTPLTDVNAGSVLLTLLEAIANEDYQQYLTMVDIIKTFNLDTCVGEDLDNKALEYGLERLNPTSTTGYVTISDSAVRKLSTKIFAGTPGPIAGQVYLYAESITNEDGDVFPSSGTIIIGRGTNNNETISYTNIVGVGSYYRFDLAVGLANAHGTEESIIYAQGGLRTIASGTVVYVPETDVNPQLNYVTRLDASILDGEESVTDVLVVASSTGSDHNVPVGSIISFSALPFTTALVSNPYSFTNGRDIESDQELRDRVKNHIQSLSRATKTTITSQLNGVTSEEQQATILSTNFIEATVLDQPSFLYIDDGTGFEATWEGVGTEIIAQEATGGERFYQLDNYPLVKASLISLNEEPFSLVSGTTLKFAVNDMEEEKTIESTAFTDIANATAEEVAAHLNNLFTLVEARTTGSRKQIIVQARDVDHEKIECTGGTANVVLGFPLNSPVWTLNLYKNDELLSKDGNTAFIESTNTEPFLFFGMEDFQLSVDGVGSQNATFVLAGNYTADEVAAVLNSQIAGITAIGTVTGRVQIYSNKSGSAFSSLMVTGGTANVILAFPTTMASGTDSAYNLNRYNGQLKLSDPLAAYDRLTAGSSLTRAWLRCSSPGPYSVVATHTLRVIADSGTPMNHTFATATLTAVELAELLNSTGEFTACTFFAHAIGLNSYLAVQTNTWGSCGSLGAITYVPIGAPGLDDLSTDGIFSDSTSKSFVIEIDSVGLVDTFRWSDDGGLTWRQEEVSMSASNHPLDYGTKIAFGAVTGHTLGDQWTFNGVVTDGSISIPSVGTTETALNFPLDTIVENQTSTHASLESSNAEDFTFGRDQYFIVVLDDDAVNRSFRIETQQSGTVTEIDGVPTDFHFRDGSMPSMYIDDDVFVNCVLQFDETTATVALRNLRTVVTGYVGTTGWFTVAPPLGVNPAVGDTFTLYPVTAKNCVDLMNNPHFTTLGIYADVTASTDGKKLQIASQSAGSIKTVQVTGGTANALAIPFASGGTATGTCTVNSLAGLSIGFFCQVMDDNTAARDVYIEDIIGASAPYSIQFNEVWPPNPLNRPDLSDLTIDKYASIKDKNQLGFSVSRVEGTDGYKYYTGLLREAQRTLDGWDEDLETYPGYKAAGVQIEIAPPVLIPVRLNMRIITDPGILLGTILNECKAVVSTYINSLGIGDDVVLTEIVHRLQKINGVYDVEWISPTSNVIVADNALARINETDLVIG